MFWSELLHFDYILLNKIKRSFLFHVDLNIERVATGSVQFIRSVLNSSSFFVCLSSHKKYLSLLKKVSVFQSLCLSVWKKYLSICLSLSKNCFCLFIFLSVFLKISLSISKKKCLSVWKNSLSICLCPSEKVYLNKCLSICLKKYPSVSLSKTEYICLSKKVFVSRSV